VAAELAVPFDPYEGKLSRAWLQDEIITVSEVLKKVVIHRHVAFRYVKMEVLGSSVRSDFKMTDIQVKATTSVNNTPQLLKA
jgi:alpha-L-rhamnosidase